MANRFFCETFAELKRYLAELPDQTIGDPSAICETGEPYVTLSLGGLARPGDVAVVEAYVAKWMSHALSEYLNSGGRSGRIYWRVPFEWDINPTEVVVQYDVNGPDVDPITDRKCVMDRNWLAVKTYCRVYRATFSTMERLPEARAA